MVKLGEGSKLENTRKSLEQIIKAMQEENVMVIVEGQHDVNAIGKAVEDLYLIGRLKSNTHINTITFDRLLYNHIDFSGKKIIIAMDSDRKGKEKKEKAISLIREKCPEAKIDDTTGERLLKILGVNCIEGINGPIKELEEAKR